MLHQEVLELTHNLNLAINISIQKICHRLLQNMMLRKTFKMMNSLRVMKVHLLRRKTILNSFQIKSSYRQVADQLGSRKAESRLKVEVPLLDASINAMMTWLRNC